MKKFLALLIGLSFTLLLFGHGNEHRTSEVTVSGKKIEIDYGSPHLGDRDLLALIRPGMIWRMGADRTTSLTTEATLKVGDKEIQAGSYGLLARNIGTDEWELLINSDPHVRVRNRDSEQDVATLPLHASHLEQPVDHLAIELRAIGESQIEFSMAWGTLRLTGQFYL